VHHTNEIAQSEAATGKRFSNYWLHNAHLLSNGTKLAKSLDNSYTLDDLAKKGYSALDFRMFILQSHYRTESNFTFDNLEAARNRLERWRSIASLRWQTHDTIVDDDDKDSVGRVNGIILSAPHAALEALNDDLNTPEALVALEQAMDAIEAAPIKRLQHSALAEFVSWIDDVLGLKLAEATPDITDEQKQQILERERAREQKDWSRSDALRDTLAEQGVYVKDTPGGAIWNKI
jgi:cysteinyl-tRNA synthetase